MFKYLDSPDIIHKTITLLAVEVLWTGRPFIIDLNHLVWAYGNIVVHLQFGLCLFFR